MTTQASQKWNRVKLGEIAQVIDCPHSTPKWEDGGIFVIRNFNLSNGRIIRHKESFVSDQEFVARTKRAIPSKGDLVLSREAPIGTVGYISTDEKMCLGQRVVLIRPEKVDSEFLLYQLLSPLVQQQFNQSNGTGTTVSNLRIPIIKDTQIVFPDFSTQKQIANVLSAYDDLIENNNRRIKILEETAQKIYKEWFVSFRFPGCEKVKMVYTDTGFGMIPEGWEIKDIGENIGVLKGKNITKSTVIEGKIPVVAGGLEPAYYHNVANAKGPVITISASGANSGFVNIYYEDIWASDCSYINEKVTDFIFFYYLLLKTRQSEVTHLQRGSAQPHVYPKDIMKIDAVFPVSESLIQDFEEVVTPMFKEVANLGKQNQGLKKTRDLLIPQLVSGKLEIK